MIKNVAYMDFDKSLAKPLLDEVVKDVRPFMVAFMITGKPIDDPMLKDIIQTQEKLCWNFGRKRKSISMGVYRVSQIEFPVKYHAVDPDKTSFVPLQCEQPMTCRQILTEHPKGKDFGWILKDAKLFPLLSDAKNEVMSMAPIINSATLGAVQVGDSDLMVELTGDNMENLVLSANIVACDFADQGYTIKPILVKHPYETGHGNSCHDRLHLHLRSDVLARDCDSRVRALHCRFEARTQRRAVLDRFWSGDLEEDLARGRVSSQLDSAGRIRVDS